jgi:hypothetical protein
MHKAPGHFSQEELPMHRAFRRAWWTLTVSAGVSLVPIAIAQQRIDPSSPPMRSHQFDAGGRAAEIQVELAWLEDPLTFPCQMAAHAGPEGLEVRGFVPSTAVRERAVRLARQASSMAVVDRLHVQANVADNPTHCKADRLQYAVADCLKTHFGAHLAGIQATCNDQGHITVSGTIDSPEDKLAVSLKLRRVAGCTCVHNHLRLPGETAEPALSVAFQPDGPVKMAEVPITTADKAKSTNQAVPPATSVATPSMQSPPQKMSSFADPLRPAQPKAPMPSAQAALSPYNPITTPVGTTPAPLPASVTVPPAPVPVTAPTSGASQQSWKPAQSVASTNPAPVTGDPAKRTGIMVTAAADKLGEAYVTTGVVMVTETTPAPTPPSPAMPPPPPPPVTRLSSGAVKSSIERACGPKIQSVEVKLEAGNKIAIQFAAPTEAEGQVFFDRIQALPELAPYEVNVKVTTAR